MIQPIYHLQPERNWMNDPNGMSFIDGWFHMFYQHNPSAPVWGNMTWGHARSLDMVRWERLPHALYPDMPYDKEGVFSGCCVVRDGIPHIVYTGVHPETVCLALGNGDGTQFTKYAHNPILTRGERDLRGWRDPYIWPEAGGYRMLIGSGDQAGGFVELYEGENLTAWRPLGKLVEARALAPSDTMWECPVMMLNEEGEAALFVSALSTFTVRRITGKYAANRFTPDAIGDADLGDCLYAPNLVRHPDGRWILFGWMRECGDEEARARQGWQGMLTLPRELALEDGQLLVRPASEVDTLRERLLAHAEKQADTVAVQAGQHFEVDARLQPQDGSVAFELLRDENGACVKVTLDSRGVRVARGALSGGAAETLSAQTEPCQACHLRIFVDGTAIEIYLNARCTLTTRAYPHPGCVGLRIVPSQGAVIDAADVYAMANCYAGQADA